MGVERRSGGLRHAGGWALRGWVHGYNRHMRLALAQLNFTVGAFEQTYEQGAPGRGPRPWRRRGPGRVLGARDDRLPAARPAPPRELRRARTSTCSRASPRLTDDGLGHRGRLRDPEHRRRRQAPVQHRGPLPPGRVVGRHHKTLLPTYDVFDEDRYFEPGAAVQPFDVQGRAPRADDLRGRLERPRLLAAAPLPARSGRASSPTAAPTCSSTSRRAPSRSARPRSAAT